MEQSVQVRRSGLDQVLTELMQHRDAATEPALRSALDRLCDTVARFVRNPTKAWTQEMLMAVDAAKRVAATTESGGSR